jgi:hypothetical protein
MSTLHTGIRAYIFDCTYNSASWVDDPSQLIIDIKAALNNYMLNFTYTLLKVANVKNSTSSKIEIEILGIIYNSMSKLTSSYNDDLIDDLNTTMLNISSLSFQRIDICNDVFTEDSTSLWPGQSFQKESL